MPYRRRPHTTRRRRPVRRATGRPSRTTLARRPRYARPTYVRPLGVAPAVFVKLKFSDIYTMATNGSNLENLQFRGNGTFDPQVSVGGGSCPYFANYAALYLRYVTYGSKIKVTFSCASSQNVVAAVYPAVSSTVLASQINDVIEQVGCKAKTVANNSAGGNIKTITMYRNAANVFGIPRIAMDIDETYNSAVTSTPSRQFYWNVMSQANDQSTNATIRARVDITYYVKFYRQKPVATV